MNTIDLHEVSKIETGIWEKQPNGYVRKVGQRSIGAVAADLDKALTKARMPYEYVSPLVAVTSVLDKSCRELWPDGKNFETFVSLEMGGNEGYVVMVNVRSGKPDDNGVYQLHRPIRVKLLTTREEAMQVYDFVFHLLGS
jgi:hypothetical protein